MARLATTGFEWNETTAAIGGPDPSTSTGVTVVTSPVRSGTYALKNDQTVSAGANTTIVTITGSTTVTYLMRAYVNFSSLGTAGTVNTDYATVLNENGADVGIYLTGGVLKLLKPNGFFGANSFTPSTSTWYRLEFSYQANSGAWEFRVDGNTIESGTTAGGGTPSNFRVGAAHRGGTAPAYVCCFDDVAVNDSQGSAQTSWPGDGKVVLLLPVSLNANGGSWTDDNSASTSAALTAALDNTPPKGIANTTAGGGDHMVRNSAANTNLDMNLTDYTTAGIGASDTVNVLIPMCNVGAPVSTGAKSGSFGITSNPTIAQRAFTGGSGTATFFWRGTAAGTYPSNWGWEVGTITYAPTVTLGTSPVARLSITGGTTSRIALCDATAMYVDYTPAASGTTYTKSGYAKENA